MSFSAIQPSAPALSPSTTADTTLTTLPLLYLYRGSSSVLLRRVGTSTPPPFVGIKGARDKRERASPADDDNNKNKWRRPRKIPFPRPRCIDIN